MGFGQDWAARFAQATPFAAVFQLSDEPGPWFRCAAGSGCVPAGTQSLAVVSPGSPIQFTAASETETVHTATSLLWPLKGDGSNADNMPFDQASAYRGSRSVTLNTPGLYVFVCKLHGMGGQGVLPIPLVYHGWVQNLPAFWKSQLTLKQQNPFP